MSSWIHASATAPRLILRQDGSERVLVVLAAMVLGLAGTIHLVLTDEQFLRGTAVGATFLALGLYEVVAAAALMFRPGRRALRAGRWGTGLIVAAYIATKVLPFPPPASPPPVSALGVTGSVLDLIGVLLLATALPDRPARGRVVPGWIAGLLVGLATPVVWLFLTGTLQWVATDAFPVRPVARLFWNPDRSGLLTPALYGFVTDGLYLFLPWWAGIGALALGILAGANVWLATTLLRDRHIACRQRTGLIGLLPAAFAAPVCCALPLAAVFGLSTATLFAGAPIATAASAGLLAGNAVRLASRIRRSPDFVTPTQSEPLDA